MKRALLTLFAILAIGNLFAQKTDLSIGLNSGLFSYGGMSAEENTFINYSTFKTYTNSIFGSRNGLSYGLSLNIKHLSAGNHFILGADLGVERLRSKVSIVGISTSQKSIKAEGSSFLNTDLINIYPNLGHRFNVTGLALDLTGGFDIGYILKAQEKGKAVDENGVKYSTELDRKNTKFDYRPRIQLQVNKKTTGAYLGYSFGLQNYVKGMVGGTNWANSRMIRFGLTQVIN